MSMAVEIEIRTEIQEEVWIYCDSCELQFPADENSYVKSGRSPLITTTVGDVQSSLDDLGKEIDVIARTLWKDLPKDYESIRCRQHELREIKEILQEYENQLKDISEKLDTIFLSSEILLGLEERQMLATSLEVVKYKWSAMRERLEEFENRLTRMEPIMLLFHKRAAIPHELQQSSKEKIKDLDAIACKTKSCSLKAQQDLQNNNQMQEDG